ncbi:transcription antitermination factor NusB [Candidatus Kaiserbacteria bacterium CG10_big_fil_rev_8_21_14_0_10_49_17]|uniref:Transcription antitermination protein NusB n=1 Tax=Candidatus Kaiserbacteria bacterium CG10_big_fil_rev_8_21_14_0_10_49_17 TaxID=1974609 RepID=A0A2M6WEW3_9BACT|nr:MAG: transcription antitermination factor NusB [Candidatus Kaiserbacteria bacterium CG10_big_fil_rev_8_21_14_0_10_49_17]
MANRHLSRSIVLQTLFELDFDEKFDAKGTELDETLIRNVQEFAPGMSDISFMKQLLETVLSKRAELDAIIEKAAPEWPVDKISVVDRNILRLGLSELLFADRKEVPAKVAINEAIELAKTFGGENSGRFVNGVLGAVYKEIGEPGKNEISKRKKEEVSYEKMPIERLGGAVVFARDGEDVFLALVHDVFGHWTLSKGHIDEKEDIKEGIARSLKDEIGVEATVGERLGKNEYIATKPEEGKVRKQVIYHLAEAPFVELHLAEDKGGLDDAKWFKLSDILELNFYDDILPIITKAINILVTNSKPEK